MNRTHALAFAGGMIVYACLQTTAAIAHDCTYQGAPGPYVTCLANALQDTQDRVDVVVADVAFQAVVVDALSSQADQQALDIAENTGAIADNRVAIDANSAGVAAVDGALGALALDIVEAFGPETPCNVGWPNASVATCPEGYKVVGGGCSWTCFDQDHSTSTARTSDESWECRTISSDAARSFSARAMCARIATP